MQPLNKTTYACNNLSCDIPVETVVGDEKQADFYPRIKIKKWDNEVNLSIGIIDNFPGATKHVLNNNVVEWKKPGITARFYSTGKENAEKPTKPERIRYIKAGYVDPVNIASYYELNRHIENDQPTITTIFSNQPCLVHYGFYPAKKYFDLSKVDLPQIRLSSYPDSGNPMYIDRGLAIIDINYTEGRDDLVKIEKIFHKAIDTVLARYDIKLITKDSGVLTKRYVKHNGHYYKVVSAPFSSGHFGCYVNLDCDYNKSFAYYHDNVKPSDKIPEPALGLRTLNKDIPDSIVDEIVEEYAKLQNLPIKVEDFNDEEQAVISKLNSVQNTQDWILNTRRNDVWQVKPSDSNKDGFEFEIELASKPSTNVLEFSIRTKNLEFHYQPELSASELGDSFRPPNVVGSYAVYHESKKNNEYMTGKICHIYRPWIKDGNDNKVWCDLSINKSEQKLLITIPQDFLNTASYPVIIDPTFGYDTPGGSSWSIYNVITGTQHTSPVGAINLTSISMYLLTSADSTAYKGAVYLASTGAKIGGSTEGTTVGVASWRTQDFTGAESISESTDYIMASWGTVTGSYPSIALYFDDSSSYGKTSKRYTYGYTTNWPATIDPWSTVENNRQYSIYVNYFGALNIQVTDGKQMKTGVKIY